MIGRSWTVPAPLRGVGPGFLVSAVIAGAASLIAFYTNGPVMLFALVIGMAMNFVGKVETCQPGIAFSSRFVLRLGVALLGFKITLGDVLGLGWGPVLLVVAAVSLTTLVSVPVARWFGFDPRFGVLSGGATAICGASAAMAAVAEALLLARAEDIDPLRIREALAGGFADSRVLQIHGRRMVERDFVPGGHVRTFLKDLAAAHGIAAAHRLDLPVTSLAHRLFEELSRTAAGCDISAMALATERRNPPHRIGTGSDRLPEA